MMAKMKEGYNLVRFYNIQHNDPSEPRLVTSVDYEVIAELGKYCLDSQFVEVAEKKGLHNEILMVIKVMDDKVVSCRSVLFYSEDSGWFVDCCESDFRVYASVAFDRDLMW